MQKLIFNEKIKLLAVLIIHQINMLIRHLRLYVNSLNLLDNICLPKVHQKYGSVKRKSMAYCRGDQNYLRCLFNEAEERFLLWPGKTLIMIKITGLATHTHTSITFTLLNSFFNDDCKLSSTALIFSSFS